MDHGKLEKDKESLSLTIAKLQQQLDEAQKTVQNREAEKKKLQHVIDDMDSEILKQKKNYEDIVQERVSKNNTLGISFLIE